MLVIRQSRDMITMVPPTLITRPDKWSGPRKTFNLRPRAARSPRTSLAQRQQHIPCVSLETAVLNELVAQLVEQRPFKAWVLGSNPSELTTPLAADLTFGLTALRFRASTQSIGLRRTERSSLLSCWRDPALQRPFGAGYREVRIIGKVDQGSLAIAAKRTPSAQRPA